MVLHHLGADQLKELADRFHREAREQRLALDHAPGDVEFAPLQAVDETRGDDADGHGEKNEARDHGQPRHQPADHGHRDLVAIADRRERGHRPVHAVRQRTKDVRLPRTLREAHQFARQAQNAQQQDEGARQGAPFGIEDPQQGGHRGRVARDLQEFEAIGGSARIAAPGRPVRRRPEAGTARRRAGR